MADETRSLTIGNTTATFDCTPESGYDYIEWHYETEYKVLEDFIKTVEPDDTIYDIGAHIGTYSCFGCQKALDGKIVAFEPHPASRHQLQSNVSLNRGDVLIKESPLSNNEGMVEFNNPDHIMGHASIAKGNSGNTFQTRTAIGDNLVKEQKLPFPNILKIDVEGAEGLVIEGFEETLSNNQCRAIYCELHSPVEFRTSLEDYGFSRENVESTLSNLGFEIDIISERNSTVHIKAH